MKNSRTLKAASVALLVSLGLTACDPPIPQEILVAQAELEIQCEQGEVPAVFPESATDLALGWSDSLLFACEQMPLISTSDRSTPSDIFVSESTLIPTTCSPFATVPVAIDAAVLVVNIPDYFDIFLTPQQIASIFNREITNWSAPELAELNGGAPLPDLAIVLPTEATASAKAALSEWISRLTGAPLDLDGIADFKDNDEIVLAIPQTEGGIGIASYSAASYSSVTTVGIVPDSSNPDVLVSASYTTLLSASSQLVAAIDGTKLKLNLDPSIEPQAEAGLEEAVLPYQAIYAMDMALCGADTTLKRTMARYFLRQDSQGVILSSTLMPLPEAIRIKAIEIVAVGLPIPEVAFPEDPEE